MKISIVTISFNQGEFLGQAIESVAHEREAGANVEYIVVDGGSTDGSLDVLARYGSSIDRLIVESDKGPADGLNKGFGVATGDVFGFLNSDDRLEPGSLSAVTRFLHLDTTSADAVMGSIRIIDREGRQRWRIRTPVKFDATTLLNQRTEVLQQATFFRRCAFERTDGFNTANRTCWDTELFADMLMTGADFRTVRAVLGQCREHEDSITSQLRSGDGCNEPLRAAQARDLNRLRVKLAEHGAKVDGNLRGLLMRGIHRVRPIKRVFELSHL